MSDTNKQELVQEEGRVLAHGLARALTAEEVDGVGGAGHVNPAYASYTTPAYDDQGYPTVKL